MSVLPHEGTYTIMYGPQPVPVGSGYRRGYLARPDKAGLFPVVVALPGLAGITPHEKFLARRLARRGLAVLVVEPYAAQPDGRDGGLAAYQRLADAEGIRVVDESHEFLASEDVEWTHVGRVGLIGVDVGGRFALMVAARRPWVGAVAVLSTPLTGDEDREVQVADMLAHLAVPTLGLYGAADELIATETVDEAQRRNPAGTWLLYENAGHGFHDETAEDYDEAAAEDAIARLAEFFRGTLPQPAEEDLG